MSTYERVSHLCAPSQLQSELWRALQAQASQLAPDELEAEEVKCCETRSARKNPGWLASLLEGASDEVYYTAVLLTPQQLIWARSGDHSQTVVNSTPLMELRVVVRPMPKYQELELELAGYFGRSRQRLRGTLIFGLGAEAQQFCADVQAAVEKVNPRPKSKRRFMSFELPD